MAAKESDSPTPAKPLVAFQPLVHPLLLRFRWHFDGDRNTNRIDKVRHDLLDFLEVAADESLTARISALSHSQSAVSARSFPVRRRAGPVGGEWIPRSQRGCESNPAKRDALRVALTFLHAVE